MANNRFLTEDFKAACTAAKPRFEWPTMSQLKQKFLAHHRGNRDQLQRSWRKFIESEGNHDYVKKPALKMLQVNWSCRAKVIFHYSYHYSPLFIIIRF